MKAHRAGHETKPHGSDGGPFPSPPAGDGPERRTDPDFYVVGVGASAGGLDAIEKLFRSMPERSGMAFIVVQHLSPDFPSHMAELLARHTTIPIRPAEHGLAIEPDAIYLTPPGKEMILSGGRLLLTDKSREHSLTHPIDQFFRSLADDRGRFAIAIVLSGTGSDGSRGVQHVHDGGGLVLAQEPESAQFDGMPRAAASTSVVDVTVPPETMHEVLVSYVEGALSPKQLAEQEVPPTSESVDRVFELLRNDFELDFSHYRPTTVGRRLHRRLTLHGDADVETYLERLAADPEERAALYRDLLIGVTRFYRDADAFDSLRRNWLRDLLGRDRSASEIRAWVAACATGEEAYTLAMILQDEIDQLGHDVDFKIFATDVHRASLAVATAGLYSEAQVAELPAGMRERFFRKEVDGFRVSTDLRRNVVFAPHNLLHDAPFTQLDLISCRNLLIYLQPAASKKVLGLFHFGLRPGGALLLGPSESPGDLADEFSDIDKRWRILRKRRDIRLPTDVSFPLPSVTQPVPRASIRPEWQQARSTERHLLSVYDALLAQYLPAAFLVDESGRLIHSFGGAERYLQMPAGRPTSSLLDLLPPGARAPLSSAIQHALRDGTSIRYAGLQLAEPEGRPGQLDLVVQCLQPSSSHDRQLLVKLEPREPSPTAPAPVDLDLDETSRDRIQTLERELAATHENLQATVEELETANEELQATNEELTASNQELQSTNEELHSVNEELYTVNVEHQRKIAELSDLTADMENLLESTEVGVVFVDRDLRIRRVTPAMADEFRIMPSDVGREVGVLFEQLSDPHLGDAVRTTLRDGDATEREVQSRSGAPFLLRITPYRASTGIDGALVTLIDVGVLREAQADLELFKFLSDNGRDGQIVLDHEGTVVYANQLAARWLGSRPEDLTGKPGRSIHERLDVRRFAAASQSDMRFELPEASAELSVEASVSPLVFHGKPYNHVILRDVTARVRTQRRIAVEHAVASVLSEAGSWSEALPRVLESFVQHLDVAAADYWTLDGDGAIRAVEVVTSDRIRDSRCSDWERASRALRLDPASERPGLIARAFLSGAPTWIHDLERNPLFRRKTAAKSVGLRDGLALPVVDDRGSCLGVLGIYAERSIGGDREVESMLNSITRQLGQFVARANHAEEMALRDRAIAAATDGIVIVDARAEDFPIQYVNEGFQRITGYPARDVLGKNCRLLQGPRTNRRMVRRIRNAIENGEACAVTLLNYRRDGSTFWNDLQITPILDAAGSLTHFIGVLHDVTKSRKTQADLRAAKKAADAANQAKSAFLANMSHEIRTPMTAILGYAEVLHLRIEDDSQRETVDAIRRNGKHLLGIIDDILDLSKIEAGKVELNVQPSPLPILLWDTCEMMRPRAADQGIDLRLTYATPIPEQIQTDPIRVRQALVNIIGNAIKFTEEGHVAVSASFDAPESTLQIDVQDTGLGMTPAEQRRLFAPFTQGSTTTSERYGGTGLGLSITRRLLDQLGGDILVNSEAGRGSTFTLRIPTGPTKGIAMRHPGEEARAPSSATSGEAARKLAGRVLVVDDQPDVRGVIELFLRDAGCEVSTSANGRLAVESVAAAAATDQPFDAVVMDIQMPAMSGYQATRAIRAAGHDTPIVALTAAAMKGERARCLRAGCSDYLAKPIARAELLDCLARHMDRKRADDPPDGHAKKILVVDDSRDSAEALAELIGLWGHTAEVATTARDARVAFQSLRPDVVLSDIQLPDQSGIDLVEHLRAAADGPQPRMIAMSGASEPEAIERALDAGFDLYLVKPVEGVKLRSIIEHDDAS